MLSLSFPYSLWPLEESLRHEEFKTDVVYREGMTFLDSELLHSPSARPQTESSESLKFGGSNGSDIKVIKKLSHNASERDRRKRINVLYSSLRSLLPAADQTKKLSAPATISRILKYIPELQREVERLQQKLTSRSCRRESSSAEFNQRRGRRAETQNSSSSKVAVSVNRVGARQVVIQMCINKGSKVSLADAISCLEKEGMVLTDSSSFQTLEHRVFCTLHLQINATQVMEIDRIKEKLLSCFENEELLA